VGEPTERRLAETWRGITSWSRRGDEMKERVSPSVRIVATMALIAATLTGVVAAEPDAEASPATGLPAGFTDELVANVSGPSELRWTPDGRMLVTGKNGLLRVITAGGTLLPAAALDLAPRLCTNGERGLVGLAVHPNFAVNHYVYLYYTYPKYGTCNESEIDGPVNRISRFVLPDTNVIDPASEMVLLETPPMYRDHHTAGDLHFGSDGNLWATIGDTGARSLGWPQDLSKIAGKIVRITDSGGIPADNPYTGAGTARCNVGGVPPAGSPAGTKCQEIFSRGFRNPYRMAMDPNAVGVRFFVNDVGQHTWEETSQGPVAGGDYGWPAREGPCLADTDTSCGPAPPGVADPVNFYHHGVDGGAATGAAFVPNGVWPAEYDGAYLFADYVFGKIYRLVPNGSGCLACSPPRSGYDMVEFATAASVVSMRFGPDGAGSALFYVTRDGSEVRRIRYVGAGNRAPTAIASATPTSGASPLAVSFSSTGSFDPDGDTLTYEWDVDGNGTTDATGATAAHTYSVDGNFDATLTVRDPSGAMSTATVRVSVGSVAPIVVIDTPSASALFSVGQQFTLTGHATDVGVPLPDSALSWEVLKHHATHTHPFLEPISGNGHVITAPEPEDLDAAADSYLEVRLTATSPTSGLSTIVTQNLMPKKVALTFATAPSGLQLSVGGQSITGPTTVTSWDAATLPVAAATQTDGCGTTQTFASWSDGGTASHDIVTPSSPANYAATFSGGGVTLPVTTTLSPVADSYVSAAEPTRNFGTKTTFRTDGSPDIRSYLTFDLSGLPSGPVTSAMLRILPASSNSKGYEVRAVSDTSWLETGVNYSNAPTPSAAIAAVSGRTTAGTWTELDVTSILAGGGRRSLALTSQSTTASTFSSREAGTASSPRLVVTTGGGTTCDSPPSRPVNLVATPASATRVDLVWDASTDDNSVASYEVFRDGALVGSPTGTAFADTSLTPATEYRYSVRAKDDAGQVSELSPEAVATTPSSGGSTDLVFAATDDTYVRSDKPASNAGAATTMAVDASPTKDLLLRFPVSGLSGRTVIRAVLRLYCVDSSSGSGGTFRPTVSANWSEGTVTWTTSPAAQVVPGVALGPVNTGTWVEVDVTQWVTGDGVVSLRSSSTSSNGADYVTSEGTVGFAPQLVVTTG
jgi:glucose/arabinose dehydrogenase/PKD repeat protein